MSTLLMTLIFIATAFGLPYGIINDNIEKSLITGGHRVDIKTRPFMVSVIPMIKQVEIHCGGTILSSTKVLTAANCFAIAPPTSVVVRAGSNFKHKQGVMLNATKYIIHPLFDKKSLDFDVAIVDLEDDPLPLNSDTIKPITLATSPVPDGTSVIVAGWGYMCMKYTGPLLEVEVATVSRAKCTGLYNLIQQVITERMICAGVPEGDKGSCYGDSGGPLITKDNVQIGIVSFGIEFGSNSVGFPNAYSNVKELYDWIQTTARL